MNLLLAFLTVIVMTSSNATTFAEFQLKCIEKKFSTDECIQTYEYSQNEKANLAYAKKDYTTAFPLYLDSAKKGQVTAQKMVAFMSRWGYGTASSKEQYEYWYKLAAEKGDKEAQYELADFYLYGHRFFPNDGKKMELLNPQEALKWALKSANKGYAEAQVKVGDIYKEGYGTIKDYKEANKWFTLAAKQGFYGGYWALAIAYEYGEGVKIDYVKSYMLWNLAVATIPQHLVSLELSPTIGRDSLEKKLKPTELEQSQKMARECVAKNFKNCV